MLRTGGIGGRLVPAAALAVSVLLAPTAKAGPTGWVPTLPTTQQSRQVLSALPDGTAYTFDVGSDAITLWHSANFGMAWDALTYLPAGISTFAQARFATDRIGYLIDFNRLLKTIDGATKPDWQTVPGPKLRKGWYYVATAIGVTGSTVAFGGDLQPPPHLGCNPPAGEDIWTSHDGGRSWLTATLPPSTGLGQVRYLNARDGVALAWEMKPDGNPCEYAGNTNSVYVTHDGGRHFHKVLACAAASGELCTSVYLLTPRHILVGRNDGTMAVSTDGGRSFRPGPTLPTIAGAQPTHSHNDADFWIQGFAAAGQHVFATTKLAGAFVSSDDGRTWSREPTCDSAYSLGIGEIAAFDAVRAIAGGPTCVSTRIGVGSAGAGRGPVPRATTGVDLSTSYCGVRIRLSDGRLIATARRVSAPRPTACAAG